MAAKRRQESVRDLLFVGGDDQLRLLDLRLQAFNLGLRLGKYVAAVLVAGFHLPKQGLVLRDPAPMPVDFVIFVGHVAAPKTKTGEDKRKAPLGGTGLFCWPEHWGTAR